MCNGSTSDSGSDCGGSNPPWGTQKGLTFYRSAFFIKKNGSIEYRFSSSPSQGGETGSTPVGAIQKNKAKRHLFWMSFFLCLKKQKGVEPRSERADRRKGAKDGTESERRRPGGSKHDVCDRRASTPVGANNKAKRHLFGCLFLCLKKQKGVEPRSERADRRKGAG